MCPLMIIEKNFLNIFFDHINNLEPSIKFTMETENDNQLPFLNILIQHSKNTELSSSIFRKPTHTDRYLNFGSDHPLQHKRAVFDTLMHRAVTLPSHKLEKRKEMKYIKTALKKNSYPSQILCSQKKTKAEITDSPRSNKDYVIILYFPGLSEEIKRSLIPHGVKTIMKPGTKLGQILSSHKDKIQSNKRQGAIYQIPCKDCNMVYIGETKQSFETRKKEHIRDIRNAQSKPPNIKGNTTTLCKHAINLHHDINWNNSQILEFETDYRKRQII